MNIVHEILTNFVSWYFFLILGDISGGNLDFFRRESADSRTGYIFLSADVEVQPFC